MVSEERLLNATPDDYTIDRSTQCHSIVLVNDLNSKGSPELLLPALIEELHQAASDARSQGFSVMARKIDECGFASVTGLTDERSNERESVTRAQACLEMWRAVREW